MLRNRASLNCRRTYVLLRHCGGQRRLEASHRATMLLHSRGAVVSFVAPCCLRRCMGFIFLLRCEQIIAVDEVRQIGGTGRPELNSFFGTGGFFSPPHLRFRTSDKFSHMRMLPAHTAKFVRNSESTMRSLEKSRSEEKSVNIRKSRRLRASYPAVRFYGD